MVNPPGNDSTQAAARSGAPAADEGAVPAARLACRDLSRRFATTSGTLDVLQEIDLDLAAGTLTAIRGPSGAGKTTLLHLLATLDRPDAGRILIDGVDVARFSADALAEVRRRRIGIIYQDCALIPRYRVWQNVTLSLIPEGVGARQRRDRCAPILESLGMLAKIDEKPGRLSGGEQQRVAIARAMIQSPDLLIADEPTSQVDHETTEVILGLLAESRDAGVAVLVASHAEEVWERADRCHLLQDGRLIHVEPVAG